MRIAICDDNMECLEALKSGLHQKQSENDIIETFHSGEALLLEYARGNGGFDAVFLDIEMEGMDGIEAANQIRATDTQVLIIFVTNHTRHMQRSFVCQPFRFLVKPVTAEELKVVYNEICLKLADAPGTFVFQENKVRIRLFCDDILFFESRGHWMLIHKRDGTIHKIRKTMDSLLESIDTSRFCRVHRAFVINMNFVYQVGNAELVMYKYEHPIPIGRTYKKEFTDCFLDFDERKFLL